ncbi:MAG TPA: TIM-barrel domain-containing protein [Candidatus Kryptonia bacterium]
MKNSLKILSLLSLAILALAGNAIGGGANCTTMLNLAGVKLRVEVLTPVVVRVTLAPGDSLSTRKSLSTVPVDEDVNCRKEEDKNSISIFTGRIEIVISKSTGAITFYNLKHEKILASAGAGNSCFVPAIVEGEGTYHVRQTFVLSKTEGLYGLGQFEDPIMNYRGKDILIAQANRTAVNPFLVSTKGYGILWDNPSESKFHDSSDGTYFWSEVGDQIQYYFVYGPTMDEVIAGYRKLTGKAPMFGRWAYGYWQSKERYQTSSELIGIVKEYRERQIPIDNIVQDWQYWGDMDQFSGMVWDSVRYKNPKSIIDSLHDLHSHLMVTIWPAFGIKSDIHNEMKKDGFLFNPVHWCGGNVYDAWNPAARDLYWKYINKGLLAAGVDAFWMDATEPEFRCTDDRYITALSLEDAGRNYLGTNARYLNSYSLEDTRGIYEHERETTDKKRVFILTRSTFTGQQRFAAATWSGDTFASWDALKTQIAAGINFCVSGIPYWTNDIGGFITFFNYPDGVKDDAYKELYVRWFEFGAFNPIFRSHGTNTPREVWQFGSNGDWAYDALVKFDRLRYRLMPYIYSTAWRVTNNGYTMMRALPMDFTGDRRTFSIGNEIMFGPSLLVRPVTKPMFHPAAYNGIDITPDHFYSADGKEHGAQLEVYRGTDFNQLVLSRKFDASQVGWIGCLPVGLDTCYSLKITGKIMSEVKGNYRFFVLADAGVQLWVNGKLLVDKWDNKESAKFEGDILLDSNKKYDFVLFHRQFRQNTANLKINWIVPSTDSHPNETDVYLPEDSSGSWYDFWSGRDLKAGQNILIETPIDMIPVYVPAGSIIPIGPEVQYASEKPDSPIEIRVYPGRNASFQLYEDENDNYDYEEGLYATILFQWDNKSKILTIGERKGEFPGMPVERKFNIVIVHEDHGVGIDPTPVPDKTVTYDGKELKIKF